MTDAGATTARSGGERDSRVLMLSQRRLESRKRQVAFYEFEDLLQELDELEVLQPDSVAHPDASALAATPARRRGTPDGAATTLAALNDARHPFDPGHR